MRSTAQGSFAALLLLIPILAVPMLAIFGVPDFAPLVESPLGAPAADAAPSGGEAPPFAPAVALPDEDFTPLPQATNSGVAAWPGQSTESRLDQEQRARLQAVRQIGFQQNAADERANRTASLEVPTAPSPFSQADAQESPAPPRKPRAMPPRQLPAAESHAPPAVNSGFTAPMPQTVASTAPLTWRAAVQRLNQMGISNFRLEPGRTADQFVFICSYTPRDNPRVSHRFEAEADEPLKAVEKVLAQIDSWLASR
ncbi:MAG TPA: hypothetical protein VM165_23795 [Planctomycetaceae bacterium]|nr:hypothetical protein [Planctomycetaceae bacterium]